VNLYLPSTLKWTAGNGAHVALTQSTAYPVDGRIEMVMKVSKSSEFAVRMRIPAWAQGGGEIKVNGLAVQAPVTKGFAEIRRHWKDGDRVELTLPLPMRLEPIDAQHPDTVALVRGPLALFALTEEAPKVTREELLAAKQAKGEAAWMAGTAAGPMLLTPFSVIHEEKYRLYLQVS
jgi:DUF1680 family protein